MSAYLMGRVLWAGLPGHLKLTAVIIADAANDEGYAYPGQERIARQLGKTVRTVRNNVDELIRVGVLTKEARGKTGGGRNSNGYQFNLDALPHPPYRANRKLVSGMTGQSGNPEQANRQSDAGKAEVAVSAEPSENRQGEPSSMSKRLSRAPTCPHMEIVGLYHEALPDLPLIIASRWPGSQGAKDLDSRWHEDARHQTLAFWEWFFEIVLTNPHWRGENDRGWKADLRWLVKRSNFDKVLERGVNQGIERRPQHERQN
ncbi:MAG: helix-turn-helix domain-containing protein [Pseudomonadota bacterium]|nr:helix-turn-helix domain-containing protein [Pseudomonadota bacterium]